jgi:T4 superinfection immunity protein
METITAFGIIIASILVYFVPTIIADFRSHRNTPAIFALNLLLGWTFLGWVGALVWSLTSTYRDDGRSYWNGDHPTGTRSGRDIKVENCKFERTDDNPNVPQTFSLARSGDYPTSNGDENVVEFKRRK